MALFVETHKVTEGLTALAIGTDQMFAGILLGHLIPYVAIVPSARYDSTFSPADAVQYRLLLGKAHGTITLKHAAPTGDAFLDAGRFIVDNADLLLAVWDGKPAQGKGGTADIVLYAQETAKPIFHIDTEHFTTREIG